MPLSSLRRIQGSPPAFTTEILPSEVQRLIVLDGIPTRRAASAVLRSPRSPPALSMLPFGDEGAAEELPHDIGTWP